MIEEVRKRVFLICLMLVVLISFRPSTAQTNVDGNCNAITHGSENSAFVTCIYDGRKTEHNILYQCSRLDEPKLNIQVDKLIAAGIFEKNGQTVQDIRKKLDQSAGEFLRMLEKSEDTLGSLRLLGDLYLDHQGSVFRKDVNEEFKVHELFYKFSRDSESEDFEFYRFGVSNEAKESEAARRGIDTKHVVLTGFMRGQSHTVQSGEITTTTGMEYMAVFLSRSAYFEVQAPANMHQYVSNSPSNKIEMKLLFNIRTHSCKAFP